MKGLNPQIACQSSILGSLVLLVANSVWSQSLYCDWLAKSGGTSAESAIAIAPALADATNIYVLGGFTSTTTIGDFTLQNPGGLPNVFLTKFRFHSTDAPLWSMAPATDGPITNAGVNADVNGDVYIAGCFAGTNLTFDSTTLTNFGDPAALSDDAFIAKYDNFGSLNWLIQLGGSASETFAGVDGGHSFSADGLYVAGSFRSSVFHAATTSLSRLGTDTDTFVAKFGFDGSLIWLKQGSNSKATCLSVDAENNCYVGGQLLGDANFDGHSPANQTGTNLLIKYDTSGNVQWVRGDVVIGRSLRVGADQNIYTTGDFSNGINFGSITLSSAALSTVFLAKYDSSGNLVWATQVPGAGCDRASGVALDLRTNCWVSGYVSSSSAGGQPLLPRALLACFSPDGRFIVSAQGPVSGISTASALGNLYHPVFGSAADTFVCGSFATNYAIGDRSLTNSGTADVFAGWIISPFELSMISTATNVVISWPSAANQNFALESTADLNGTTWSAATSTVYTVNGQRITTNNISAGSRFFRLRSSP